jgi:hypothetical protein
VIDRVGLCAIDFEETLLGRPTERIRTPSVVDLTGDRSHCEVFPEAHSFPVRFGNILPLGNELFQNLLHSQVLDVHGNRVQSDGFKVQGISPSFPRTIHMVVIDRV